MRATIKDVARTAGVSISTVSRVLNDTCPVSEDKRDRVEQAVAKLGYRPDPNARGLIKQRSGGVGVILPSVSDEFFSLFLTGIDNVTHERGFYLLISSWHRHRDEFEKSLASLYGRVDGLLIMAPGAVGRAHRRAALGGIPCVQVNTKFGKGLPTISIENEQGFIAVTEHVLSKGRRRVALIKGPRGVADAQERTRGFRRAIKRHHIPKKDVIEVDGDFTRESGYSAAENVMTAHIKPTAIVAQNDLMALGALSWLFEHGYNVPDDVMVTGFDDVPAARYSTPSLTTVRVPIQELGVTAMTRLINLVENGEHVEASLERLRVDLIPRASTAD